ncbi:YjgN family protein [Rhizobium sp.]
MTFADNGTGNLKRAEFRGNAREYFGIWIVNVLLTIITLGIYSAWAKVRRMRYFRANTYLDGHSFDYHAKGLQIFLGRFILFIVLSIINVITTVYPLLGIATPFVFLAILPWFVVRSLKFNARVTSYRNVRLDFVGTAWGAFKAMILGGLVSALSLGILAPFASRWVNRYVFNNLRYGDRGFSTDPKVGALYRGWVVPAMMVVIGLLIAGAIGWILILPLVMQSSGAFQNSSNEQQIVLTILAVYAVIIPIILIFAAAGFVYRVMVRNVVLNSTLFDDAHPLYSDLSRGRFFWIYLSNFVITVLTLGLMRPWAACREARYIASHTGVIPRGDIGEIMASIQASGNAISAEYTDMEGMDFGF